MLKFLLIYLCNNICSYISIFKKCLFFSLQSTSASFSVVIQNINCFNTGIICRKDIFINVGKSSLIFDDETGNPVSVSLEHGQKVASIHLWIFFILMAKKWLYHLSSQDVNIFSLKADYIHIVEWEPSAKSWLYFMKMLDLTIIILLF